MDPEAASRMVCLKLRFNSSQKNYNNLPRPTAEKVLLQWRHRPTYKFSPAKLNHRCCDRDQGQVPEYGG
jgi:hypothetical protein